MDSTTVATANEIISVGVVVILVLMAALWASIGFAEQGQDLNSVLKEAKPSGIQTIDGQSSNDKVETKKVHKLGFKSMDTVKSINGEKVDSPAKAMELYNKMKSNDTPEVERTTAKGGATAGLEIKNLDSMLKKATANGHQDMGKLLQQFRIVPFKNNSRTEQLFRVVWVEGGSIFEREGLKAGDIVTSGTRN